MDIKKYLATQQAKETTQQANFGDDADTVFGMLCSTYYELNCNQNTEEVKQALDNCYHAMTGKAPKDKAIYDICRLCSLRQQTGFVDGIRLGLKLAQELNT